MQMPEEERGHKQLGRAQALSHLAQLGLTLLLGILVMAEPLAHRLRLARCLRRLRRPLRSPGEP